MSLRLLLDTHALLWWAHEPERLSRRAYAAIEEGESDVFVSAVSAMEIATKSRIGKLGYRTSLAGDFVNEVEKLGFRQAALTCAHGDRGGSLAIANPDPFDRMLIAQAQLEDMVLVSNEKPFDNFGVLRLW